MHPARAILFLFVREHNFVCDELAKRYPARFTAKRASDYTDYTKPDEGT